MLQAAPTTTNNLYCASRRAYTDSIEYILNAGTDNYDKTNSVVDSTCAALTVCDSARD